MRHTIGRGEFDGRYANIYDHRGQQLFHTQCDALVGYGPEGYVIRKGSGYWAYTADGASAGFWGEPNFQKAKWDLHDTYLRVFC